MGWFNQNKAQCSNCGMEAVENQVCTYCGKSFRGEQTKDQRDITTFAKRKSSMIQDVHIHDDDHVLPIKTAVHKKVRPAPKKKKNPWAAFVVSLFFLAAGIGWGFCLTFLLDSFSHTSGRMPETGNEGGLVIAGLAFLMALLSGHGVVRNFISLSVLTVTSLLLIIKPFVAPVKYYYQGQWEPLSTGAESHMYYILPGVLLAVFTLIYCFILLVRLLKWLFRPRQTLDQMAY